MTGPVTDTTAHVPGGVLESAARAPFTLQNRALSGFPPAARNVHSTLCMHPGREALGMRERTALAGLLLALIALATPAPAGAGCGCSKPPPPRAAVRPFVGSADQKVVLFSDLLEPGATYWVQFTATADGSVDWSRGKATTRRDFADGAPRAQLRVPVGSVAFGPCSITVWSDQTPPLYALADDQFTVVAKPVVLHDFTETVTQDGYQTGVGKDGTVYIPVDVSEVSDGTIFSGMANGFPLAFEARSVAMYNQQGFLMQLLDPTSPGLFRITRGADTTSDVLTYWRHEFRTYKQDHRRNDAHRADDDPDWHADGTPHIDHDRIVVAVSGSLASGDRPAPGATPAFQLVIQSVPSEAPLQ